MRRIGTWSIVALMALTLAGVTPASAMDVNNVSVRYATVRVDEAIAGYLVQFVVQGTGLTGVNVKNLNDNSIISLANSGPNVYSYAATFGSFATFNAQYPNPVPYLFTFNPGVGEDAIVLSYNVTPPDNYVNIIHPAHLSTGVELDPVYSWDDASGLGGYQLGMRVRRDDNGTVVYENTPEFNTALTTWQPGVLDAGTKYNFDISVFKIMRGEPILSETLFHDALTYYAYYEDANEHTFTTGFGREVVPEPASLMLLGSLAAGAIGVIRRRRMK